MSKTKKKKKVSGSTIFFVILLLVGASVMAYPKVSDWWNSKVQSKAIASYDNLIRGMTAEDFERYFAKADEYNQKLRTLPAPFSDHKKLSRDYYNALDISGMGIIGYITIPFIDVELPIYHGTSEDVLNIAVGHLEGSSLPVGGENTHAVLSAHRGLPSARLFTDLDQLVEGDLFTITVLDRILTYEVEKILTVKPEEIDKLAVIPGGDYVTLMTCTPYGINTHRLLIRAKRTETVLDTSTVKVFAEATKVDPMIVIPFIAAPLFLLLLIFWGMSGRANRKTPHEIALSLIPERKVADDEKI